MIDTHTHLYLDHFKEDIDDVIHRAVSVGVEKFYLPSISSKHNKSMHVLENKFPDRIFCMIVLHPCYVDQNFESEFEFVKEVGIFFHNYVDDIIQRKKDNKWEDDDKVRQLVKRGRYAEFNLLYDRGTKFGLETGGNVEAILMSMPPQANWE